MRILLTNDDGIGASGLHAARRALRAIDDIQLDVIAPDADRSGTARSITTRSPLSVQEFRFEDGGLGHATDGTPVDCVRFAEVGLLGASPDMIVSGINHGLNVGDDVTYSGTVAAAFEGIVLGIPAIAISLQSTRGEMGYRGSRQFDFDIAAGFLAEVVGQVIEHPLPADTLININVPSGVPDGVDVVRLGRRLYRDELRKVDEDVEDGRRRYKIYGYEPEMADESDTDVGAVARKRIAVTPLHLNLTYEAGLEGLASRDLERSLESAAAAVG